MKQRNREEDKGGEDAPATLTAAHEALERLAERVTSDPTRPAFHFLPRAGWMNDPNGTILQGGSYHLFYQHDPFRDRPGNIHWGHARSKDLVSWEHLPIALWPSDDLGETNCYSGCCTISPDGTPTILYTKVGPSGNRSPWEQWAATSDDEMVRWRKYAKNPVLSLSNHGGPRVDGDWRDPYLFRAAGRSFLILGAKLAREEGGDYAVLLYEAAGGNPLAWSYRGILLRRPAWEGAFFECPNFLRLDGKWLLIVSPFGPVEYYSGDFDLEALSFQPSAHGRLDAGLDYYATNTATTPDGRTVLFGWVRGFRKGRGWNGCLALPRELRLGDDGAPLQQPVRELARLRRGPARIERRKIDERELVLTADGGSFDCAEIDCSFRLNAAAGVELRVRRSRDGRSALCLRYDGQFFDAFGTKLEYQREDPGAAIGIRLFVDRNVFELFIDGGRRSVTRVSYPEEAGSGISIRTLGGEASLENLTAWQISPADIRSAGPDSGD